MNNAISTNEGLGMEFCIHGLGLPDELFEPLTPASPVTSDGSNRLSQQITDKFEECSEAPRVKVTSKTKKSRQQRDRNNDASRKSRAKKKQQFEEMKVRVAELEEETNRLKCQLTVLTKRHGLIGRR